MGPLLGMPHHLGTAGIIDPDNLWQSSFSAAVAELSVGRLMAPDTEAGRGPSVPDESKPRLTVRNRETGETVLSVPYIEYCLMVKGRYEDTDDWYEQPMSDQEYLDRQDEYNMTFFLDPDDRWIDQYIYINSWHLVIQHAGLGE